MAHLALYVDTDMHAATRAVNTFLQEAGSASSFDPEQMTTMREALRLDGVEEPSSDLPQGFRERLVEVLRATRI